MIRNWLWKIFVDDVAFIERVHEAIGYSSGNLTEELNLLKQHFDDVAFVERVHEAIGYSSDNLEEELNLLEKNLINEIHSRVPDGIQTNKFDAASLTVLRREIEGMKSRFADSSQIDARISAYDERFSARLNKYLSGKETELKRDIEAALRSLQYQDQIQQLQVALNSQISENKVLKQTVDGLKQTAKVYEQQLRALEDGLSELQRQVAELQKERGRAEAAPSAPRPSVPAQQPVRQPAAPSAPRPSAPAQQSVRQPAAPSAPQLSAPSPQPVRKASAPSVPQLPAVPRPSGNRPWIASFSLSKPSSQRAFFHGDGMTVKSRLMSSIHEVDGLRAYLSQLPIDEPARTSFWKNLSSCKDALVKLYNKFDFAGCDPEELSEDVTEKFFEIIKDNLLDNVVVAIYRGGQAAAGYEQLLLNVNRWLSDCCIYTQSIEPGMAVRDIPANLIEPPLFKRTSKASEDGMIDEVELLPYFMVYEDEDGNPDCLRTRGRIICLKYGA